MLHYTCGKLLQGLLTSWQWDRLSSGQRTAVILRSVCILPWSPVNPAFCLPLSWLLPSYSWAWELPVSTFCTFLILDLFFFFQYSDLWVKEKNEVT